MSNFRDERLFGGGTPAGELILLSVEVAESDFNKGHGEVYLGFSVALDKKAKAAKKKAEAEFIISLSSLLRLRIMIAPNGEVVTLDPNKGLKSLLTGCRTLGEAADKLSKFVGRVFTNTPINGVFVKKDGNRYAGTVAVLTLKDEPAK